jgi:hypothetical protein
VVRSHGAFGFFDANATGGSVSELGARAAEPIASRLARRGSRALCDPGAVALAALIALHLVPIWAFAYFPSQDGPSHVDSANVIRECLAGRAAFTEYFTMDHFVCPNMLGHVVLALLMGAFSPVVSEKLLLTGYTILFPVSVRYALAGIDRSAAGLSLLALPLAHSWLLYLGFYNFALGLPLAALAVGYWLRHGENLSARSVLALAGLMMLLLSTHVVCLAVTFLIVGVIAAGSFASSVVRGSSRRALRPLLLTVAAGLPSVVLALAYMSGHVAGGVPTWFRPHLVKDLAMPDVLRVFDDRERWLATGVSALFAAAVAWGLIVKLRRGLDRFDWLLVAIAALAWLYVSLPDRTLGGSFLISRLELFLFVTALLWLAGSGIGSRARALVQIGAAALAVGFVAVRVPHVRELSGYFEEYAGAAERIAPGATVLPICLSQRGRAPDGRILSRRVQVFLHAAGYVTAARDAVNLGNYEAHRPVFPIRYRADRDPYVHLGPEGEIEAEPPSVDFLAYPERTGGRVDYVLVWGQPLERHDRARLASLVDQLRRGYDLIYTSPVRGNVALFRRKAAPPP